MDCVRIAVLRVVDEGQPFFVECELIDKHGKSHFFVEKLPVVCAGELLPPCAGGIRCTVLENTSDTALIDTEFPDGIASTTGEHRFEIWRTQMVR